RISPDLLAEFASESGMLPSWGFCFRGANGRELRYDFKEDGFKYAPFYTSRRLHLDNFLVKKLDTGSAQFMSETTVTGIDRHADGVEVYFENRQGQDSLQAKIVIGGEGEKPIVTRHLGLD